MVFIYLGCWLGFVLNVLDFWVGERDFLSFVLLFIFGYWDKI